MNHYEALGITRSATNEDIEDAFIRAAEWQAKLDDGSMTAVANAHRIKKAYEILIDPESRKQYERDIFRKRIRAPYLLPGQRPPKSHLWWITVGVPIVCIAAFLLVSCARFFLYLYDLYK